MFERTSSNSRKLGLTSLIDMVFLLLVFFMLTTTFQRNQATRIDFAQATQVQAVGDTKTLIVTVRADGQIGLDKRAYSFGDFRIGLHELLANARVNQQVVVQSTPDATVQQLVRVLDVVHMLRDVPVTVVEGMVPGTELHQETL